jgi:hypothetical protein
MTANSATKPFGRKSIVTSRGAAKLRRRHNHKLKAEPVTREQGRLVAGFSFPPGTASPGIAGDRSGNRALSGHSPLLRMKLPQCSNDRGEESQRMEMPTEQGNELQSRIGYQHL